MKSRVCDSDVSDGQISSLVVQLQSVSESLSTINKLNICTNKTDISSDLSDASVIKIPSNSIVLACFYTSVKNDLIFLLQ